MYSLVCILYFTFLITQIESRSSCYDQKTGQARKCSPDFINAAYLKSIDATNTCGSRPIEYCVQSTLHSSLYESRESDNQKPKKCDICDEKRKSKSHPASYLTDYNSNQKSTWWQSETMLEGIQYPNSVNLTLNLGKSFHITYVQIRFQSPRPESFAIYKRTNSTSDWTPYQYYSASCQPTYGVNNSMLVFRENEAIALCTDEFSDIAPLSGSSVAFSTLEGRPSAYFFDNSDVLKEWVTATEIKIVLNRLNTFGDEIFNDAQVLKSYYYAISDISVGGRCKCNGHASDCKQFSNNTMRCVCEHNTDGVDCEKCAPFYNDIPWSPATHMNAYECLPCNCNSLSDTCYFDQELYDLTGHGGHCTNCRLNTDGANCEKCLHGFYRRNDDIGCIDCQCDPIGSESLQCDPNGKCKCKSGVTGEKCDQCAPNHYDLTLSGCKQCECNVNGSIDSPPVCSALDGACACKANVEGKNCDRCKPGFYDLQFGNTQGCLQCFCYGHSVECTTSDNHEIVSIDSKNSKQTQWLLTSSHNANLTAIFHTNQNKVMIPFNSEFYRNNNTWWIRLPDEFLGNKRLSFNQELRFQLRFSVDIIVTPSRKDIVLENSNENIEVYMPISTKKIENTTSYKTFTFRLNPNAGWLPTLNRYQFNKLLSNLTSIKIRVNYGFGDTFIHDVSLENALLINGEKNENTKVASFVEQCKCPNGYTGQFCDLCQYGFKRERFVDPQYSRCIPCTCNNHSLACDQFTGKCSCMHHTVGDQCEQCETGYYGNALTGTANDCKKCPCPNNGPCAEIYNYQIEQNEVVCLDCPTGTQGNVCELCDDGYFSVDSTLSKCEPCKCNDNIDSNAIYNCDKSSGKCLRCVYNTTGDQCEKCLSGYWGNALTTLKCHACECYPPGTTESSNLQCDLSIGQCSCKPHVVGRQCDECEDGFWNITSNVGCTECNCSLLGSFDSTCNVRTGQCNCRPGVVGLKCDKCASNHFDFSETGCKPCNCDPLGSTNAQCDDFGKCECKFGVAGKQCNRCEENKFNFTAGCTDCDICYNLVQTKVVKLRDRRKAIENFFNDNQKFNQELPAEIEEQNNLLESKLKTIKELIDGLHTNLYKDNQLMLSYNATILHLEKELEATNEKYKGTEASFDTFYGKVMKGGENYNNAQRAVTNSKNQLKNLKSLLEDCKSKISQYKEAYIKSHDKRLPELAEKARKYSEDLIKTSKEMEQLVDRYVDEGSRLVNRLNEISQYYKNDESKSYDYESVLKRIKNLNDETSQLRESLKNNLTDVNLYIQKINEFKLPDTIKNDSNEEQALQEHQKFINAELESLNVQHNDFVKQVDSQYTKQFNDQLAKAQKAFESAKLKNKDIETLALAINTTKENNENSVKDLNSIYKNATNMLNVLENFEKNINQSKEKSVQAESSIPDIQKNVAKSNEFLNNLKENLMTYEVKHAEKDSSLSVERLKHIKESSNDLLNKSSGLNENAEKLSKKYQNFGKVKELSERNRKLDDENENLKKRAESLSNNTQNLLNNVNDAFEKMKNIEDSIETAPINDLKEEDVKRLILRFEAIELNIKNKTLFDVEISVLTEINLKNEKHIKQAEEQINNLQRQVDELDRLNQTLVKNCYKNTKTETEISEKTIY